MLLMLHWATLCRSNSLTKVFFSKNKSHQSVRLKIGSFWPRRIEINDAFPHFKVDPFDSNILSHVPGAGFHLGLKLHILCQIKVWKKKNGIQNSCKSCASRKFRGLTSGILMIHCVPQKLFGAWWSPECRNILTRFISTRELLCLAGRGGFWSESSSSDVCLHGAMFLNSSRATLI